MQQIYNDNPVEPFFYDEWTKMPMWIYPAPCEHQTVIDNYHKVSNKINSYIKYSTSDAIILIGKDYDQDFIFKIWIGYSDQVAINYFFPLGKGSQCEYCDIDNFELKPGTGKLISKC